MNYQKLIDQLPYSNPFLFVDVIREVSEDGVVGSYTFKKDEFFYRGHFKDYPITPGVILTECMAQIGVVCLGVYLARLEDTVNSEDMAIALSESQIEYLAAVKPGETVTVSSQKIYYRFGKLKCKVQMMNDKNQIVCRGTISGMLYNKKN